MKAVFLLFMFLSPVLTDSSFLQRARQYAEERHERPDGGSTGAFSLSQASVKFWFEGGLPSAINDLLCGLLVLTALLILMCRLLQCFSTWAETPRRQRLPDDRRS